MRVALFSDIHGNREALAACLEHAAQVGAVRQVFLGDYVGYGADAAWVVETVRQAVAAGAQAVLGNHDQAVWQGRGGLNPTAEAAMVWTRANLPAEAINFLRSLPMEIEEEDRLYVHADASAPSRWQYVTDAEAARRSMAATDARLTLCGHVHVPALFGVTATEKLLAFRPVDGVAVPVPRPRRWLAVLGAVGQPRDGNPAACYTMLDTEAQTLTWHRVPYDVEATMARIRAAGLPDILAARLAEGR